MILMPCPGRTAAGFLVAAGAILVAAQQCPELLQDDVTLMQQNMMAVSGVNRLQNVLTSEEQSVLEAMSAQGMIVQSEGRVLPPWPLRLRTAEGSQAWWSKRLRPWLSFHFLLGTWAVLVNIFIVWQLLAVAPWCVFSAASCEATPAGQAAVTKEVAVQRKTDATKEQGVLQKEAVQQQHAVSGSLSQQDSRADEHSKAVASFRACWALEVERRGLQSASLVRALLLFLGWWQLTILLALAMAVFSVNSLGMVVAVQWMLEYMEWLRVQHDGLLVPDPFYSCLAVLVLCFMMPVSGFLLDMAFKAKDARVSAQLVAALSAASDKLSENIVEVARDAVRVGLQCVVAAVGILALLALLWTKVGISTLIVVVGFILLVLVTLRILAFIVQPRVTHQVASERRLSLLQNTLGALQVVRCNAWEEPLMKHITEARSKELDAAWSIQHAISLVAALGAAWPRLITLAVLTSYAMRNPVLDAQVLFLCLQVLSCITCQVSTLSLGFSKMAALGPLLVQLESSLKSPNSKQACRAQFPGKSLSKPVLQSAAPCEPSATRSFEDSTADPACGDVSQVAKSEASAAMTAKEEAEASASRVGFDTLCYYLSVAGWPRVMVSLALIFVAQASMLLMDNSLAQWSDEADLAYELQGSRLASCWWLRVYAVFCLCCLASSAGANIAGVSFSRSFSEAAHWQLVNRVLFNQTERSCGKEHTAQMMKHLSVDMSQVDFNLWSKIAGLASMVCAVVCPMAYVHFVMPYYFTLLVLPYYMAMATFTRAFFKALRQAQGRSGRVHLRFIACFACIYTVAGILNVLDPELLSFGDLCLVFVFCTLVLQSLEVTIDQCIGLQQELVAVQRVREAAVELPMKSLEECSSRTALPEVEGWLADGAHVEIRSLFAGYGDETDVLRGIVLEVNRHQKVGIVGAAGSGKSTLLLTLLRAVEPRQGRILLDSVNVTNVGLKPLRLSLGFLPQEPLLLQGSVRFNLDPFSRHSAEKLTSVLRQVGLERFSQDSDRGLNLEVGSVSARLRAGLSFAEIHLLCLARLLLQQPPLLLLDEVCAPSLDKRTQESLRRTVLEDFPRSTIIATSRKAETLVGFDRVLTLRSGQLLECS